ncbi:aminoglycoside 6-adenylyltransferase [Shouchella shacheensis]|uniref:aminoglycoside 6-adenylyltransferase n=1 Tax=Shouchella shacheensis TaxID=1649580 RepID=UPI0007402B2F|nr:aminoglycoside 6-adenylyltransferase [Shouchella shacheensis]
MRTEEEMLRLIVLAAEKDERVRAVMMNGSRVNPNVQKDRFQDYDIVYYVQDLESFTADHSWVDVFGQRVIMQMPEATALFPAEEEGFSYLMQFEDGNRIDLTLLAAEDMSEASEFDSLSVILLDKDERFPVLPDPNDSDYITRKPTTEEFSDCQNEFWWVTTYVAKGVKRRELPYAKATMEGPVRKMLVLMLQWEVGSKNEFAVNTGKDGRWLESYLEKDVWEKLVATYAGGTYAEIWEALFAMCELFEDVSASVARALDYELFSDRRKVFRYLKRQANQ